MSMTQPHISSSLVPEAADGTSSTFEAALPPSDDPPNILPKTVKPPIIPRPPSTRITRGIAPNKYSPSFNTKMHSKAPVYRTQQFISTYRISMKQALKDPDIGRVESAQKALVDELKQLIDMQTFEPTPIDRIPMSKRSLIIPSFIFFKEKFKAGGSFNKWKGRLVAGGNFVDTSLSGDISASVVNPLSVMMMLSIVPIKNLKMLTADIKGAFLIPELDDTSPSELTYIRIDKTLSDIIEQLKPEWRKLRNRDGTFTMKLKKALYGLPVSAFKWMTHLNETLTKLGFQVCDGDKCCFTRGTLDDMLILCSHVDDLLVIGKRPQLDKFKEEIQKEYDINIQDGYKHSYLGLDINQNPASNMVTVGQAGYKHEVINRFIDLIRRERSDGRVPCGEDILLDDECDELVNRTEYMSIVMSIMYLARFTRPDLSFAVGMLSTHCTAPTYTHYKQAIKLLKYLAASDDYVIVYKSGPCAPEIYADASHAIHIDGKGHGCILMKVGSGMVYVRSFKLKMITLSSTESEWIVLCEATTLAEWTKAMLLHFGISVQPILIRQDNTSAIWLAEHGGSFARTKHLLIKKNKAKEGILNGTSYIRFTPGEHMCADMGTKPLGLRPILLHMQKAGYMIPIVVDGRLNRLEHIKIPAPRKMVRKDSAPNSVVKKSNVQSSKAPPVRKATAGTLSVSKRK